MQIEFAGENMRVSELIKTAILSSETQQKEVAERMGWSPQSFANRLKKNTIDAEEWVAIAHILGYEIKMVSRDGTSLQAKRAATGPRVQQVVDGYSYDTNRADELCRTPKMAGGSFALFRDLPTGKFFVVVYCDWSDQPGVITTATAEKAKEFYQNCCGEPDEDIFRERETN